MTINPICSRAPDYVARAGLTPYRSGMSGRAWLLAAMSTGVIVVACSGQGVGQCLDANGYPLNPQPDLPGCRFSASSDGSSGSSSGGAGAIQVGNGGADSNGAAASAGAFGSSGSGGASVAGSAGSIGLPEAGMGGEPVFDAGAGGVGEDAGAGGVGEDAGAGGVLHH